MAAAGPSSIHHRVACRLATRAKPSASLELGTQGHVGRSDDLRRWPTAAPTATPADRGGRRRAEAAEASRSQTPTNGAELRKGFEDRGDRPARPETGLVVRPFPQTEEVTAGRAASGGLPTRQVVAEDGPRPSREPVADADTSESLRRLGGVGKLGWDRAPIPPAQKLARGLPGGLFGAGYWGSSGRTLAAWGPLGPTSRRTRRLGPHQVSGSQPPGSR
jgi:hypothetical protein